MKPGTTRFHLGYGARCGPQPPDTRPFRKAHSDPQAERQL